jgi:uncharacterized damage-inducible protein DinB
MEGRDRRPAGDECSDYHRPYAAAPPDGDIVETLAAEGRSLAARLRSVPAAREPFRYAPGKWSIREVVGHIVDTERVFAYRAAAFGRGDPAPLPNMDQDAWALASNAADRPLRDLVEEFEAVRASTVALFRGLPAAAWDRRGSASGREVTVRALAWITAGHAMHHDGVLVREYGVPTSRPTSGRSPGRSGGRPSTPPTTP